MRNIGRFLLASVVVASAVTLAACAGPSATVSPQAKADAADPCHVASWTSRDLYGTWQVDFPDLHETGTLLLSQHPVYRGSLRGHLKYGGHTAIASGDIQQGELDLDESRDDKTLFAMWTGDLVPSSCGKEIRGTWQRVAHPSIGVPEFQTPFILRRESAKRAAKTSPIALGAAPTVDQRTSGW